jgi:hypothetical protein
MAQQQALGLMRAEVHTYCIERISIPTWLILIRSLLIFAPAWAGCTVWPLPLHVPSGSRDQPTASRDQRT